MMSYDQGDFILAEGEVHVICPYNQAHVVTNARLIVHLDKCRRAYLKETRDQGKSPEYKECRFNYRHHVLAPEIKHHEDRCKDRYSVVQTIQYHNSSAFKVRLEEDEKRKRDSDRPDKHDKHEKHRRHSFEESDDKEHKRKHTKKHKHKDVKPQVENIWGSDAEDWEAESQGYTPAYAPDEKLKQETILYQPKGLSKSERKTYRQEQREKSYRQDRDRDRDRDRYSYEEVDVKPFSKLDVKEEPKIKVEKVEPQPSTSVRKAPPPPPPPKVKQEPVKFDTEKEDGECSEEEEEFYGEDPFS